MLIEIIQHFALMIYKVSRFDDIHGIAVIGFAKPHPRPRLRGLLAAARSRSCFDSPPDCHSFHSRRFATLAVPRGGEQKRAARLEVCRIVRIPKRAITFRFLMFTHWVMLYLNRCFFNPTLTRFFGLFQPKCKKCKKVFFSSW